MSADAEDRAETPPAAESEPVAPGDGDVAPAAAEDDRTADADTDDTDTDTDTETDDAETDDVETEDADTGEPLLTPARQKRRRSVLTAVTGVLALALGLGLTVQIRASKADEPYSGASQEDLVAVLNDVEGNDERLRQQLADSRAALQQLTDDRSESDSALDQAEQRVEAIGILTGQLAAEGPGIRLSISDPDERIRASLLLEAVQELRGAGAEAIQVNGVRVVVSSAFVDTAAGIQVEGLVLTEPYTVLAIG